MFFFLSEPNLYIYIYVCIIYIYIQIDLHLCRLSGCQDDCLIETFHHPLIYVYIEKYTQGITIEHTKVHNSNPSDPRI